MTTKDGCDRSFFFGSRCTHLSAHTYPHQTHACTHVRSTYPRLHTCLYTSPRTYIHTTHVHIHMSKHTYPHCHASAFVQAQISITTQHTCPRTCLRTCPHTSACLHMHMDVSAHMPTCVHTHTPMHMCVQGAGQLMELYASRTAERDFFELPRSMPTANAEDPCRSEDT